MSDGTGRWWSYLLAPLGLAFLEAARLKSACHRAGLLRGASLPAPALAVGNLTFGGTGKTPFTLFLARRCLDLGLKPAILSRGYGRETTGPLPVSAASAAADVGEEPLLMARGLPGVPVAVGERREEAAALVDPAPDLFLLDDAFQHQRVARDGDLLLVDASRPGDLRVPPVGRLREPLSAVRRADLLVVTRGSFDELPPKLRALWGGRPAVSARFRWHAGLGPDGAGNLGSLHGRRLLAFAGTARPETFFAQARQEGLDLAETLSFPDHAEPTAERQAAVRSRASALKCDAVLTTEKDALKWLPSWKGPVPLLYVRLETLLDDPQGVLDALLLRLARRGTPR